MKKTLAALALGCLLQANANAGCRFNWHHYGDNTIRDLVAEKIGAHVTNEYCTLFGDKFEIVIQFNAYTLPKMVAGHATVGIRKKGSKAVPAQTLTMLATDSDGRTSGAANNEAVRATLAAVDNLMSELRTYKVAE